MSKIKIGTTESGEVLYARIYGPVNAGKPGPAVLFLRGWSPGLPLTGMDLYAWLTSRRLGVPCLSVQFRGMGGPGDANKMTRADFLEDTIAAYDYLLNMPGVDSRTIYAVGESFGSYMASMLSTRRELKGLLLRVPTDFPNEGFSDKQQSLYAVHRTLGWKQRKHEPAESYALEAVSRFMGRMLIVEAGRDTIVPRQTVENYGTAAAGRAEYIVMKKASHGLINPVQMRAFYRIALDWLTKGFEADSKHL